MRTSSFALLFTGIFLALTTSSCVQRQSVKASQNYITQKVKTGNFNAIKVLGSADIIFKQSNDTHVEIYGSDNVVPLLETYVDNHTLIIKFKKNVNVINRGKLQVGVASPELNNLTINGSGNVKITKGIQTDHNVEFCINGSGNIQGEKISCHKMGVSINGSGDVKIQGIQSKECYARIAGSGDIDFNGKTGKAEYSIAGSGDIDASSLRASDVTATTTGSGDISCYASKKLTARVSGSGNIAYKGNPQEIDSPRKGLRKLE